MMSRWSYHIPILGYHRVGPSQNDHVPTVSAFAFEKQLSLLKRWRIQVLTFGEMMDCWDFGKVPRRSVVITFDDGYEETCTVAWPLLKRFGMPATVFVVPAEVGNKGFVSWPQIKDMAKDSFTIGSHTTHHSYIPTLSDDRLSDEIAGSKHIIEQQLGRPVDFLCYPIGGYSQKAQAVTKAAGYRAACTTNRATSFAMEDRFAIRRIKITNRDANPFSFWFKLSGYYDAFRKLPQPGYLSA